MPLTNLKITGSIRDLWRIEETIRFIKQIYQLTDSRLLTYVRLQNMMAIVTAMAYFTMPYAGLKIKLRVLMRHPLKTPKRVLGIPEFRLCPGHWHSGTYFRPKMGLFQGPIIYPQPKSRQH